MRMWPVLVLLLLPGAQAITLLEEGTGDVQMYVQPGVVQGAPAGYDPLDLQALDVEETADKILFRLTVAGLDPQRDPPLTHDARYIIVFTHHDQNYIAIVYRAIIDQPYHWGFLVKSDPGLTQFTFVRPFWNGEIREDSAAGTITVEVQREDITDTDGAAPFPGRALSDFWALSTTRSSEGFLNLGVLQVGQQFGAFDRMPNVGNSTSDLPITLGLQQSGHARLFSPAPMRASNGEATTFVYNLTATHSGDTATTYDIIAGKAPNRWTVTVPFESLVIKPGQSVTFPVLVTIPFAHQHGSVETMRIEVHDRADAGSVGRAEIGIRFHAVPQPAGHHDTIYIHSQRIGAETGMSDFGRTLFTGTGEYLYFNTLDVDENDLGIPVNGQYQGWGCFRTCTEPEARWQWNMFLQPTLEMGLDFDLERKGTIHLDFDTDSPLPLASFSGELMMWRYAPWSNTWQRITLAEFEPTAPTDYSGSFGIDWEFTMKPVADRLDYRKLSYLGIFINASTQKPSFFTGAEAPQMLGGQATLPLNEYHDAVTDIFATTTELMWMAKRQERLVNPGEAVLFNATLHNTGGAGTFRLDLAGGNAPWATLIGARSMKLGQDDMADVQILVQAPPDASDGERADLILSAISLDDPTQRALLRVVAVVDSSADHHDDRALLDAGPVQKSPLPVVLLLVAVAVAFRRRPQP